MLAVEADLNEPDTSIAALDSRLLRNANYALNRTSALDSVV